jgi:hypothetical protein
MADLFALALTIPCAYCGAQPGERCVTRRIICRGMSRTAAIKHFGPSGTASYIHTARSRPVWAIYWAGMENAGADGG